MRESSRNFLIGLCSIGGLLGLAFLLMSFGELDPWLHPRYVLTLITDNASGLKPGGTIEFNGVPVGNVNAVYTAADPDYPQFPVRIICKIDKDVKIPADAKPFAASPLIGGSSLLQLQAPVDGEGAKGSFFPNDDSAKIPGPIRGGMLAQITDQLDMRMKPLLQSLERFNKLSDSYTALGESLNDMVKPQDAADPVATTQPNMRTAVVKLNKVLDQAAESLALAKSFLGDEQMRADVRGAVTKANSLIENATTAIDKYSKLADSLQTNSEELARRLPQITDALASTLEEVRKLTKHATEGKGTVAQLMNNPDLYNSLNDASLRLQETLTQAKLLIEKLRAEGVTIKF